MCRKFAGRSRNVVVVVAVCDEPRVHIHSSFCFRTASPDLSLAKKNPVDSKGHGRERFCEDLELIAITEWVGRWRERRLTTSF